MQKDVLRYIFCIAVAFKMLVQVTYSKLRAGCAGNELADDAVGIGIVPPK